MRLLHSPSLVVLLATVGALSGCSAPHWDEVRSSELALGDGATSGPQPPPDSANAATLFAPHDHEVQGCLDRASLRDPELRCTVTGQAAQTEVVGSMPGPVKDCIEKATQGWMWPEVSNHSPVERKTYRLYGE
jgi:hypothetical protein